MFRALNNIILYFPLICVTRLGGNYVCCLCFRDLNAAFGFMTVLVKSLCVHYFNLLCYDLFPLPYALVFDLSEICWQIVFTQGLIDAFPPSYIQVM